MVNKKNELLFSLVLPPLFIPVLRHRVALCRVGYITGRANSHPRGACILPPLPVTTTLRFCLLPSADGSGGAPERILSTG